MANKDGTVVAVVTILATALIFLFGRKKKVVVPPPPPPPGMTNLYGVVTDVNNQPINQVQVSLESIGQAGTDVNGQYLFDHSGAGGIPPGNYIVNFIKQGYQSQSIDVVLQEGNNQLNVQMVAVAGNNIYGRVTDAGGVPLSGVSVTIYVLDRRVWTATTDAQGNYSVANIVPGDWANFTFVAAGYETKGGAIFLQSGNTELNAQMNVITPSPNPDFYGGSFVQIVSLLGALTGCEQVAIPPGTISPYLSTALIGTIWKVSYRLNYPGPKYYFLLSRDNYLLGIPDTSIIPAPEAGSWVYAAGKMANPDTCQW